MKRSVTNPDKPRRGEMNLKTNLLANTAPQNLGERTREREMGNSRKGAYQMYLQYAYHNTKCSKLAREYSEAAQECEE